MLLQQVMHWCANEASTTGQADLVPFILPCIFLIAELATEQEYAQAILPHLIPIFGMRAPYQVIVCCGFNKNMLYSSGAANASAKDGTSSVKDTWRSSARACAAAYLCGTWLWYAKSAGACFIYENCNNERSILRNFALALFQLLVSLLIAIQWSHNYCPSCYVLRLTRKYFRWKEI